LETSIDDLHDPYLLKDMDKAVARIKIAKENNERVFIFGDYDVDGVTSTSILMHFFKKI
jgi:single-stranded-DNA-specific exonuclease